jgi:hypothetical protein
MARDRRAVAGQFKVMAMNMTYCSRRMPKPRARMMPSSGIFNSVGKSASAGDLVLLIFL